MRFLRFDSDQISDIDRHMEVAFAHVYELMITVCVLE